MLIQKIIANFFSRPVAMPSDENEMNSAGKTKSFAYLHVCTFEKYSGDKQAQRHPTNQPVERQCCLQNATHLFDNENQAERQQAIPVRER
jgi:hypothetical protein